MISVRRSFVMVGNVFPHMLARVLSPMRSAWNVKETRGHTVTAYSL